MEEQFHGFPSADPPSGGATFANCTAAQLADERYPCTNYVYAPMLQNIISSVVGSTRANAGNGRVAVADTLVSEGLVQFSFANNTSDERSLIFVPSRQALRDLSSNVVGPDGFLKPSSARLTDPIPAQSVHLANMVFR